MGRPSRRAERRQQILDAFERCVIAHGLEATTLEAVAAEAGVQRAAIRHFVGNRDELIAASVGQVIERGHASYDQEIGTPLVEGDRVGAILDHLFQGGFVSDAPRAGWFTEALSAAAYSEPEARRSLRQMYATFEKWLLDELMAAHPGTDRKRARGVAYSIVCLAEQNASLLALGFPATRARAARDAAGLLAESLQTTSRTGA